MEYLVPEITVKRVIAGVIALFVLITCLGSFYIVQPNEVAMVRRLGTVEPGIIKPGLHWKLPFFDTVDDIPISIQRYNFPKTTFFSADNQTVELALSVTYRIPTISVEKLLYGMGRVGNVDVSTNIQPIISQKLREVVGRQNITSFNLGMDKFTQSVKATVMEGVGDWVEIMDVQIAEFDLAPSFKTSNEQAMRSKNEALAAEYTLTKIQKEAEQVKAKADGEANATRARAQAEADAKGYQATADAAAITLKGRAEATALDLKAKVLAANPQVTAQTWAEKWGGGVPSTVMGDSKNFIPMMQMSAPQNK